VCRVSCRLIQAHYNSQLLLWCVLCIVQTHTSSLQLTAGVVCSVCCVSCRLIQARYNSQLVLTVSMKDHCLPSSQPQSADSTSSYSGCPVTLQRLKTTQFGRANQRWTYDQSSGFIIAFSTNIIDKGEQLSAVVGRLEVYA